MRVIAIAGLSCSGKTTLAHRLSREYDAPVIALDDYYLPLSELTFEERTACNFDAPEIFDHLLLAKHLDTLHQGRTIEKPVYDFVEFTRATETQLVAPAATVILEGMYSLHWDSINALTQERIFLDVPPAVCLERRIARDTVHRGRTPEEVRWRFERDVMPMYERFVYPSRVWATVSADQVAVETHL